MGESFATVEKHATPLWEAMTPSLEALKAYTTGHVGFSGSGVSIPLTAVAVEIDPQFAMAWANLGLDYSSLESLCCRLRVPQEPGNCGIE